MDETLLYCPWQGVLQTMEKLEKEVQPRIASPGPSEHEGLTPDFSADEQGNGQLKRNLSRRLIHVSHTCPDYGKSVEIPDNNFLDHFFGVKYRKRFVHCNWESPTKRYMFKFHDRVCTSN